MRPRISANGVWLGGKKSREKRDEERLREFNKKKALEKIETIKPKLIYKKTVQGEMFLLKSTNTWTGFQSRSTATVWEQCLADKAQDSRDKMPMKGYVMINGVIVTY